MVQRADVLEPPRPVGPPVDVRRRWKAGIGERTDPDPHAVRQIPAGAKVASAAADRTEHLLARRSLRLPARGLALHGDVALREPGGKAHHAARAALAPRAGAGVNVLGLPGHGDRELAALARGVSHGWTGHAVDPRSYRKRRRRKLTQASALRHHVRRSQARSSNG